MERVDGTIIQDGTFGSNCYCLNNTTYSYTEETSGKQTGVISEANLKNLVTNEYLTIPFINAPTGVNNGFPILEWQVEN